MFNFFKPAKNTISLRCHSINFNNQVIFASNIEIFIPFPDLLLKTGLQYGTNIDQNYTCIETEGKTGQNLTLPCTQALADVKIKYQVLQM